MSLFPDIKVNMLKDIKVQAKLTQILAEFVGYKLIGFDFKDANIDGKDVMLLELMFDNKRTAVVALDKDLTAVNEDPEVVDKLINE